MIHISVCKHDKFCDVDVAGDGSYLQQETRYQDGTDSFIKNSELTLNCDSSFFNNDGNADTA